MQSPPQVSWNQKKVESNCPNKCVHGHNSILSTSLQFDSHQQSFWIFTGANPWICRALGSEMFAFLSAVILHHTKLHLGHPEMWFAELPMCIKTSSFARIIFQYAGRNPHWAVCEGYSNWYAQRAAQYAVQQSKLAHSGGGNINRWSYISLLVEHSSSQHIHTLICKHQLQGRWTLHPWSISVDCGHTYLYHGAFVLASVLFSSLARSQSINREGNISFSVQLSQLI